MSVVIEEHNSVWILSNEDIEAKIDLDSMTVAVLEKISGDVWHMATKGYKDFAARIPAWGDVMPGSFSGGEKEIERIREKGSQGIEVRLSLGGGGALVSREGPPICVKFLIPDKGADLTVEVAAPIESPNRFMVKECLYPRSFILKTSPDAYTVLPVHQGCIIPANWPKEYRTEFWGWGPVFMPWFGAVREKSGYIAILETPFDAAFLVDHTPDDHTFVQVRWKASKGSLSYPRRIRYTFRPKVSYVDLAKLYREYSKEIGRFRSLADKIKEKPNVSKWIGATHVPFFICWYDVNRKPKAVKVFKSFWEGMKQIEELKSHGLKHAVIHAGGHGKRGYDNFHPDPLPPCEEAGGWEGLIAFSRKAKELGYLFSLHDNYRDFYRDGPAFNLDLCIKDELGRHPEGDAWDGGPQSVLCAAKALDFVKRNFKRLLEQGVALTASAIDVFTCVPLDECSDPKHPMTRTECAKYRSGVFEYISSLGITVASEEGADWSIPYLDVVYSAAPQGPVSVPLYALVYHDAVFALHYVTTEREYLQCLLYGYVPYPVWKKEHWIPNGDILWDDVGRFAALSKVLEHTGSDEMTGHRFLSEDYSIEEVTYGSGAKITVDFKRGTYAIKGISGIGEEQRTLLAPSWRI